MGLSTAPTCATEGQGTHWRARARALERSSSHSAVAREWWHVGALVDDKRHQVFLFSTIFFIFNDVSAHADGRIKA